MSYVVYDQMTPHDSSDVFLYHIMIFYVYCVSSRCINLGHDCKGCATVTGVAFWSMEPLYMSV